MIQENEIDKALQILRQIKLESNKDDKYAFSDDWNTFIKKMQFLSPKSFGTRIQNRIIDKNGLDKTNPTDDLGDFCREKKVFEFKTSIINTSNKVANFVNLRKYQKIDGYYLVVINTNKNPYETLQFKLSKEEMNRELELMNANPSNGTKKSNEGNENVSFRFSIDLFSINDNSIRWKDKYLTNDLIL